MAQAQLAGGAGDAARYRGKLTCARYWIERMMPECPMLFERIQAGSATIMSYDPAA